MFVVAVLRGEGSPERRVGGLSVLLRIVLSAQRCGAKAVHVDPTLAPLLVDERITVPVSVELPPGDVIECPWDVLVHPDAFAALARAMTDGRAHAMGPVVARPLGAEGTPVPLPFAQRWAFTPMPIRRLRDAVRGNTALLRACRKESDGWTARHLNRVVSLSLTRVLLHTGLRPNHLTMAIVLLGLASGVVASRGTHDAFVWGAALLQAQSTLDGCDGELARMTFRQSKLGEWLDTLGDDLSNNVFFGGAAVGMFRATSQTRWLLVGAVLVSTSVLASAIQYRWMIRAGTGDLLASPVETGRFAFLRPLFKRDTFILLTFVAAALGRIEWALVASTLGALVVLVAVVRAEH